MAWDGAAFDIRSDQGRAQIKTDLIELLRLAGPVVLSRLGIMAMGLADSIVVGRYSAQQLGFHALAWAPTAVAVVAVVGLLGGVQVMTARAIGEGRPERAGAVLRRGLAYGLWIGLGSMAPLLVFGPMLLRSVGLAPGLAEGAIPVLVIFSLSLPFYAISVAATFWLEALAKPIPVTVMMWAANGVNLLVLLILVPGGFGLPALGAVGGAWATFAARLSLAISSLVYIALLPRARGLGVFRKPERDEAAEVEQRRIGYGAGASGFFEVAAFSGMNLMAGVLGALAVAAWAVALNVVSIIFMAPLGLSAAAGVLVGRAYGAGDHAAAVRSGWLGFGVATLYGILAALIILAFAPQIAGGYTRDAAAIALAAPVLALSSLFLIPDAIQVVAAQALRARGDVVVPTLTHLTSYVVIMIPLAWWLALQLSLGLAGIVWGVIVASLVSAGLLLGRFSMLKTV
jgi:MATE family multidrug resistance protein